MGSCSKWPVCVSCNHRRDSSDRREDEFVAFNSCSWRCLRYTSAASESFLSTEGCVGRALRRALRKTTTQRMERTMEREGPMW